MTGLALASFQPILIRHIFQSIQDEYITSFSPSGCRGSRAKILESRLPLFQPLISSTNEEISTWGIAKKIQWKAYIASEYKREVERDTQRNERFEW